MTSSNGNIFRVQVLALCVGISPVPGEFPAQRPVTRSFDVFFDLRLNKPLGKQWWGWWFETPSRRLWRHCNGPSLFVHRWFVSHVGQQSQSHQTQLSRVPGQLHKVSLLQHDDVIKWKHLPRYWPFVRGIHWSLVNSTHKGQWCEALMFSLICVWIIDWVNNREADDLRRYRGHYDVTVIGPCFNIR